MPRILFIKTSSMGDVVHHCPAVSDAARALPGAEIDWMVEAPFAGVAALHHAVRRVIPVAVRRWRRELWRSTVWSEMAQFHRSVRAGHYDFVVDSQGLLKSALLARIADPSGAHLHGYDRASAREPLAARLYRSRHAVPKALHAVERNRRLTALACGYTLDEAACDYGLSIAGASPVEPHPSYVVLLTMTSRADKLWPEASWIALGRALAERKLRCVLPWGDADERARCRRIAQAIGWAKVPGRMALDELARLFRGTYGIVGVDTGLTHLAAAVEAPTVGIYCATDPSLTGLYGAPRARNVGGADAAPAVEDVLAALEAARAG
ncbi:MAG: lipopolysaccharide heptosyltransferase I [Burkholderiales bacterium]|nr:lipopolysaccharide heptosyltransferase I [Burkholderiales bacterium]